MEQQGSPASQFFQSPAESLMSAPEDAYTSLFAATTPSAASTVNPMDMLTPKSYNDDSLLPMIKQEEGVVSTPSPSPAPEKKTTKKRKSWGQVLPEPKTNLPPRKRAKTADEKEQRRVERVLRNRRAAQSSRERKRQEVEQLEKRNKDLEAAIQQAEQMNARLMDELAQMRKANGLPPLSQELFSPQTTHQPAETMVSPNATVDPMALSPCLSPVPEESEETLQQEPAKETTLEQSENTSPDLTQRPAAMLSDLQCHMSAEVSKMSQSQSPTTLTQPTLAWLLPLQMTLFSAMALLNFCQRPLTQIVISSKTGISLHPSPQLLTSLIWSLTRPRSPSTTASTTSCTTPSSTTRITASRRSSRSQPTTPLRSSATSSASTNLRTKSLRKILSSSPSLARPLLDATLVALRLVSEGRDSMVEDAERETEDSRGQDELVRCLSVITLPSRELLLTLAWAIKHYLEAPIQRETGEVLDSETRSLLHVHQPSKKKAALSVILEEENNRTRTL